MAQTLRPAGFGIRLAAYVIDILPITLLTAGVFYLFAGFDQTVHQYLNRAPGDIAIRAQFLHERNLIRDLAFLVYVLYCGLMEGSSLRATVGKHMMGLIVICDNNRRLTFGRSFSRNVAKILSYIPFGLGFLWALFSKRRLAWHDRLSGTAVMRTR
jgi:uncharacterized RDD family membrane protein YckC